jgi:hypothetical protein
MFVGEKLEVTTELIRRSLQQVDISGMHASSSAATGAESHLLRAGSL